MASWHVLQACVPHNQRWNVHPAFKRFKLHVYNQSPLISAHVLFRVQMSGLHFKASTHLISHCQCRHSILHVYYTPNGLLLFKFSPLRQIGLYEVERVPHSAEGGRHRPYIVVVNDSCGMDEFIVSTRVLPFSLTYQNCSARTCFM
jgi:hypothetical protein